MKCKRNSKLPRKEEGRGSAGQTRVTVTAEEGIFSSENEGKIGPGWKGTYSGRRTTPYGKG